MPVSASKVFEFFEQHHTWSLDKYEIHSVPFSALRRAFRTIILTLSEYEDTEDAIQEIRYHIAKALTVPVRFDEPTLRWVESALGPPEGVLQRWGRDTAEAYKIARSTAGELAAVENPLRIKVRELLVGLENEGTDYRIYCHRTAEEDFCSIPDDSAHGNRMASRFLHSVRAYDDTEPFDTLLKVGPLRAKGWGAAPDVLFTAPRFSRLIHLVWSGCSDEDDFGYDPARLSSPVQSASESSSRSQPYDHRVSGWHQNVIRVGGLRDPRDTDIDDLRFFRELSQAQTLRKAVLVHIDEKRGILLPPEARVPSFDPSAKAEDAIAYRIPSETLGEGMFLIWPEVEGPDLGGARIAQGRYSVAWKARLREAFANDPDGLLRRLSAAGVNLQYLRCRVRHWCRPPSNVIPAPQQREHFRILIQTIGMNEDNSVRNRGARDWWEYAWIEIARTRGEAIQSGFQEQEIIDEELFTILRERLPEIRQSMKGDSGFALQLPANRSIEGGVQFYTILGIEHGFLVPDVALRVLSDLDDLERWRA